MNEFFDMGGHGPYVWSAYGITFVILVISGWSAVRSHRRALQQISGASEPTTAARKPRIREL